MEFAYDPGNHRLNLAVSNLMKLTNDIERYVDVEPSVSRRAMETLAIMLHPLAPHTSAEIREILQCADQPLQWPSNQKHHICVSQ
jgi:leucyl-tRNA synthetase